MTEPIDRAAIKARAEAATAGPWETTQAGDEETTTWIEHQRGDVLHHDERGHGHMRENFSWMKRTDAEFIAHAREDIPALLAALEEAERERDEWKRKFGECHPIHLDGVTRAYAAERRIAAVEEVLEIGLPDERDFTAPAEYIRGAMDAHEWWHAKLRAALHPVAETTEREQDDE